METLLVWLTGSQSCEQTFRLLRSMTPTFSTIVNFTLKGILQRLHRLNYISCIESMHELTFPRVKRKILQLNSECLISTFAKPNLQQIEESITKAKKDAIELSTQCGMALEKYENSHIVRNTVQITEEAVRNDCEENSFSQELQVESTNEVVLPHDEVIAINEDLHQLKVTKSTSLYGFPTYKAPAESTDLSEDPRGKQTAKHFALTKNAKCAFVRVAYSKYLLLRT